MRPSLPFPEMSHRSKLRATEDLRQEASSGALLFAAASNNQKDGRRTSAQLVQAVASPHRGPAIARRLAKPEAFNTSYTPEEALALLVDIDLSKDQYWKLRMEAKARGAEKMTSPSISLNFAQTYNWACNHPP